MPRSPAASSAAKHRYGLASAPGMRDSVLRCWPWPTMRNPHVRLSWPHASVVGAQLPAAYRLYELMLGARKIASSDAYAMWPDRYCLNTSDSPSNVFRVSFHRLEWTWHELPIHRWSGLAMNVTEQPAWCAISLIPFL